MLVTIVGLLGFISSFLSNLSGGAGSLILLPALLALGVEPIIAIGTIKFAGLGIVLGTNAGTRQKGLVRKEHLVPLLIVATLASIIGPQLSLHMGAHAVKIVSSVLIIITALFSLFSWRKSADSHKVSKKQEYIGYGLYFLATLALAGFGSGVGLISTYVLMSVIGLSALEAVGTRRAAGLVAAPLQLIPFMLYGKVDYGLGIALLIGSFAGGYLGLKLAIKGGNEFVKRCMAAASIILLIAAFAK